MRIDRMLCNLRFVRTRSLAAKLAATGHLRCNGLRVTRASQDVAVGDVVTVPMGARVRLFEVLALPEKRGPAREAQACYRMLDQAGESDLGASNHPLTEGPSRP